MTSAGVVVPLVIIAVSAVCVAITFLWMTRSLVSSTDSLRSLVRETDRSVQQTIGRLQDAVEEVNAITRRVSGQMDRLDTIVGNIEHITGDARSSMHIVDETIFPIFSNLKAVVGGMRRGMEVWRETGETKPTEGEGTPQEK